MRQPLPQNFPRVQMNEDFFQYELEFSALAPGDTITSNIQIQADSDFKWVKSQYQCNVNGSGAFYTYLTAPVPLVTVQIVDQASQRQLFFAPTPISNTFGRGILPFILPIPRIFRAMSSIGITVANFSADQTYDISLILSGIKIFAYGGEGLPR